MELNTITLAEAEEALWEHWIWEWLQERLANGPADTTYQQPGEDGWTFWAFLRTTPACTIMFWSRVDKDEFLASNVTAYDHEIASKRIHEHAQTA